MAATVDASWPELPAGAVYAVDVVDVSAGVRPALSRLFYKTAVVRSLAAAAELVVELPDVTAVTIDGDLVGDWFATGGSTVHPSLIEVAGSPEQARQARRDVAARAASGCTSS